MSAENTELPKAYEPAAHEKKISERWLEARAFAATPDDNPRRYVIMMPLPNVTGALHMGHAMDNVMQDLLIRWHRMTGENTLWMPGTDHASIATQAIVEKRLLELEGKTRHDIGRDRLVERIQAWTDQSRKRIVEQQQAMGCSCDWERQRFTMDAVCRRAVRWAFFAMFRDGLIYRGHRLVNWDCLLQTAVSDDEIVHETVQGHFWHLRYPIVDPRPGEPAWVVVATTRPETMLGDTAVAVHPDPARALEADLAEKRRRLETASAKDRAELEGEIARLEERRTSHLPLLLKLRDMARDGRLVRLPLLDRPVPLILDAWAKPGLGSGCVKITPGHDPNDYAVWQRRREEIEGPDRSRPSLINILNPDGTLNENAGPYKGLDRFAARERVDQDLERLGLIESVEEREIDIGHSDRSKTPIEPYLSKQWFVAMADVPGGVLFGRGTPREFRAAGLAQAAIDAARGEWRSASGRKVTFHPDPVRYGGTYLDWLGEKRDWCISRQLWWGHRIPIWSRPVSPAESPSILSRLQATLRRDDVCARLALADGSSRSVTPGANPASLLNGAEAPVEAEIQVCLRDIDTEETEGPLLSSLGFAQDPDVLDTWFSSGLWPQSTLGWPDPETAEVDPGQPPLGASPGRPDALSYYYPGSCLVTARDIITLWVARMVVMGLYNLGDVPFTDVFIHANILDGKGERMSKSKGNGIDPVDIIDRYGADAMRYVLCEMQTGTQDIRLPVQAISPHTGEPVDLATAKHGGSIFTYLCPKTGKEFDVLGTMPDVPAAQLISDRFEVGRNFCNKLWNAARFALLNLESARFRPLTPADLADEDLWILSRLSAVIEDVEGHLEAYNPSAAIGAVRDFFWGELCDWYLEMVKPRLRDLAAAPPARQVLATAMDQILRLLHPFVPFITEVLWEQMNAQAPERGIEVPLPSSPLLIHAAWPQAQAAWRDVELERRFASLQDLIRAIRDVRSRAGVPPSRRLAARVKAPEALGGWLRTVSLRMLHLAGLDSLEVSTAVTRTPDAAVAVLGVMEVHVAGVVDPVKERTRLEKKRRDLLAELEASRRKLSSESFLSRAKPEAVEKERARSTEIEAQLNGIEASLSALGSS